MSGGRSAGGAPDWLRTEAVIAGRILVLGLTAAGAIWVALQMKVVVTAVVLGLAEVAMLWPVARRLRRWRVPNVVAALICVLLLLGFFAAIVGLVIVRFVDALPQIVTDTTAALMAAQDWLQHGPVDLDSAVMNNVLDQLVASVGGFLATAGTLTTAGLAAAGNLLTVLLIATFFTVFTLTSGDRLWAQFLQVLPPGQRRSADSAFREGMRTAGAWFYASTATGLVDGVFIGLGLMVLKVPLAVPIGALTFVMGYVPMVGATLAGALAVLVAGFSGGLSTAAWALVVVLLVQQIEGNVLSPLLMSRALSFHPVVTLLLTTGAATAFGIIGLFLAVPVVGVLVAGAQGWRRARPLPNTPDPVPSAEGDG